MISRKKFAEWNKFDTGKFYGTPISEIEKANNLGKVVLLDIEINGAKQIFETYGSEAYYVFLKVNEKVANDRSEERGTETPEEKAIRIENLRKQQTLLDELLENGKNFFDSIVDTNELEEGFIANIVINDFISRNTLC